MFKSRTARVSGSLALLVPLLVLGACQRNPLTVTRSLCPAVAVPQFVGDTTLFAPPASRDASAIDVTATIINLRGTCTESPEILGTTVNFDVAGQRRVAGPARAVTLPIFIAMVQGGNVLVSKQVSSVTLNFAEGQLRTQTASGGQARVARAATTLPPEIQAQISRKREPGDADAAIDPLADPTVKAAVRATSFEVLVGFQLDDAALAYNALK
ncbi:MAG: hypothetical protein ACRCUI_05825 [Polymorphobacter sp.]